MRLRDDERGQSVQIGAVLLFAVLIISFSTYQAFVVPDQNREVEFDHSQRVQTEMQDLRNAIVSMHGGASPTATSVTLGTTYPSRAVALNPGPPSGTLRTAGTTDPRVNVSIANATARGETGDVWNGTARTYGTGGIVYQPSYNVYDGAPTTVYEHTLLYDEFRSGTIVEANQTLVDGKEISLVVVNGSLSRTSTGSTSVDVRPISSSTERVRIENASADAPVTINFTSRLPPTRWETILSDEDNVVDVRGGAHAAPSSLHSIQVELRIDVSYRLQLTKVGVGTGATAADVAYLTDVEGEGARVTAGQAREITLQARDDYDNPVADVSVDASVGGSGHEFVQDRAYTDDAGEVTFVYNTTKDTEADTHRLNFTTDDDAVLSTRPFDQSTPRNVTVNVSVRAPTSGVGTDGDGSAYDVNWSDPSEAAANGGGDLTSCSADACTWDVGGSDDATLTLNSTLSPDFGNISMEYAVSNSTVGTVSPGSATTGANGAATVDLTANENGTVDVLASANGGTDVITITVENVTGGGGGSTSADAVGYVSGSAMDQNSNGHLVFQLENNGSTTATIRQVSVQVDNGPASEINESNGGGCNVCHEMSFVGSDDGYFEAGDGGTAYTPGSTVSPTDTGALGPESTMEVHMTYFQKSNGQRVDVTGRQITVTVAYADGSSEPYTFTP